MFIIFTLNFTAINEIILHQSKNNIEKMWQAAHKLKGSCLNLGAQKLANLCNEIENKGKSGDITHIKKLTSRLQSVYSETEIALKNFLKG